MGRKKITHLFVPYASWIWFLDLLFVCKCRDAEHEHVRIPVCSTQKIFFTYSDLTNCTNSLFRELWLGLAGAKSTRNTTSLMW
jgi:hypothetical protein